MILEAGFASAVATKVGRHHRTKGETQVAVNYSIKGISGIDHGLTELDQRATVPDSNPSAKIARLERMRTASSFAAAS